MDLKEYQKMTAETAVYPHGGEKNIKALVYVALGLAGEAGEAVDVIKKIYRHGDDRSYDEELYTKLRAEMGDVMWYLARMAEEAGFELNEILDENYAKLQGRKQAGTLKAR